MWWVSPVQTETKLPVAPSGSTSEGDSRPAVGRPDATPESDDSRKVLGRNLLTAALADGRRGTLLRMATLLVVSIAVAVALARLALG